jgi:alkylated DNA repair dioxygenase AlkB
LTSQRGTMQSEAQWPDLADQLIVTEYQPGQGIFSHVDVPMFADTIVTISLGSTCVMEFVAPEAGQHAHLLLEPLSALVLSGEGRSTWKHSIPARTSDLWQGRSWKRTRRVSLSFRKVL